jgi:hypothetical protein
MSIAIGMAGLILFRFGMWTSIDSEGVREVCSSGLAGCGMAAFLAALAGMFV